MRSMLAYSWAEMNSAVCGVLATNAIETRYSCKKCHYRGRSGRRLEHDNKPAFVYNYLSLERYTVAATNPLPKSKVQLKIDFAHSGKAGELGKGAYVTMTANGIKVAEGALPKTIPQQISIGEGLQIGSDVGSPVDFTSSMLDLGPT